MSDMKCKKNVKTEVTHGEDGGRGGRASSCQSVGNSFNRQHNSQGKAATNSMPLPRKPLIIVLYLLGVYPVCASATWGCVPGGQSRRKRGGTSGTSLPDP